MSSYPAILSLGVWLGILTSVSPCPLASNIAAVAYIAGQNSKPRSTIAAGLAYALGRALSYIAIAGLLSAALLSAASISHLLQKYMNKALGPVLILAAMLLWEMLPIKIGSSGLAEFAKRRLPRSSITGAFVLGALFVVSFCPVSAAIFFGSLVPLTVQNASPLALPLAYGLGSSVPVIVFSVLLAAGANSLSRWFSATAQLEYWARQLTAWVFALVGVYFTLVFIFEVSF